MDLKCLKDGENLRHVRVGVSRFERFDEVRRNCRLLSECVDGQRTGKPFMTNNTPHVLWRREEDVLHCDLLVDVAGCSICSVQHRARGVAAGLFGLAGVALSVMTLHRAPSASESLVVLAAAWGAALILLMIAAAARASRAVVLAHVTTLAVLPCVAAVLYRGVSWEPLVRTTVVVGVVCGVTGVASVALRNVREWLRPIAEGAGIVAAFCAAAFALHGVGCDAVEGAAVLGALVVLGLGAVARAAVPSSGLAGLARSVAAGTPVA